MESCEYSKCSKDEEEEEKEEEHFRDPSLLSQVTLSWMNAIFSLGNKRYLERDDLLELEKQDDTKRITENLKERWQEELENRKAVGKHPRLWLCAFKAVPISKIILMMFQMSCCCICVVSIAIILNTFLRLLQHRAQANIKYIWACAVALPLLSLINGVTQDNFNFTAERIGMQIKAAIKGVIYHKILRTEKETIRTAKTGHVINLLSNDAQRIQPLVLFTVRLVYTPFYLISISVYLCFALGWPAVTGIALCVLVVPSMFIMFAFAFKNREKMAASADLRIGLVTECVTGIRSVKAHALEEKYEEKVDVARRKEMRQVLYKNLLDATIMFSTYSFRQAFTFAVILTLFFTHEHIRPSAAFLVVTAGSSLAQYYLVILQWATIVIAGALKSLQRVQDFLLLPDLSTTEHDEDTDVANSKDTSGNLTLNHVTCSSYQDIDNTLVKDVTLDLPDGEFVALTGQIGSGKSSLLLAIMKEMPLATGNIICSRNIAYVPQTPWVFSGTLRENITFHLPYEHEWYGKVIAACELEQDLKEFPDGDATNVGERGVTLSGGQQSRISLARAVYANVDVYLLDDPLSAVDVKVGEQIFDKCINGLLGKKTRVLVTHNVEMMKKTDTVVVLEGGSVRDQFTWSEDKQNILSKLLKESHENLSFKQQARGSNQFSSKEGTFAQGLKMEDESKQAGRVSWKTYWGYFTAGSSQLTIIGTMMLAILGQVAYIAPDLWLTRLTVMDTPHQRAPINIYIYIALNIAMLVFVCARGLGLCCLSYKSSVNLHRNMVASTLHATVHFFDTTPAGRIINRFSKDFGNVDDLLPMMLVGSVVVFLFMCSSVIVASLTNYWILIGSVPLMGMFLWLVRYYLKGSRELKRLDAICGSPVFSHAMETMNGLETIRTRRMQKLFVERFYRLQNKQNQAQLLCIGGSNWIALRAQMMFSFLVATVSIASVLIEQNPGLAGLALGYCLPLSIEVVLMAKWCANTENLMTSTERVMEYIKLPKEPGYEVKTTPPDNWPTSGHIVYNDVTLRYYDGGPSILKGVSCDVGEKSKVGIAGRTGAGKSSLVAALMRMPEAEGSIMIDGVDISSISLQESRKCISVFSQTSVLFSGSIRDNLDPFDQYTEVEMWSALGKVQLKSLVGSLEGKLEYQLTENGSNLSMGEKQLLCLARTLLRRNKILVLDEPTAHVDPLTESLIQQALHEELQDCTVITIAHRLNTLSDCEKVMVLENGEITGYGTTAEMLSEKHGSLARIIDEENSSAL